MQCRTPRIGRRTGINFFENKTIRTQPDGIENFEDYWTSSDSESSSASEGSQYLPISPRAKVREPSLSSTVQLTSPVKQSKTLRLNASKEETERSANLDLKTIEINQDETVHKSTIRSPQKQATHRKKRKGLQMPCNSKKMKKDKHDSNDIDASIEISFNSSTGMKTSAQKSAYQHVNGINNPSEHIDSIEGSLNTSTGNGIQSSPKKMPDQQTGENTASSEESSDSSSPHGILSNKRKRNSNFEKKKQNMPDKSRNRQRDSEHSEKFKGTTMNHIGTSPMKFSTHTDENNDSSKKSLADSSSSLEKRKRSSNFEKHGPNKSMNESKKRQNDSKHSEGSLNFPTINGIQTTAMKLRLDENSTSTKASLDGSYKEKKKTANLEKRKERYSKHNNKSIKSSLNPTMNQTLPQKSAYQQENGTSYEENLDRSMHEITNVEKKKTSNFEKKKQHVLKNSKDKRKKASKHGESIKSSQDFRTINDVQTPSMKFDDHSSDENNTSAKEKPDGSLSPVIISNKGKRKETTNLKEKNYVSSKSKNKEGESSTSIKNVKRSLNFSAKNNVDVTTKKSDDQHLDGDSALFNKNLDSSKDPSKHSQKGKTQNNLKKSQKVRKKKNQFEERSDEPQQLRRSSRNAGPPLASWRSEYKRCFYNPKTGETVFMEIDGNKEEKNYCNGINIKFLQENQKKKKPKQEKEKALDDNIEVQNPLSGKIIKLPLSRSFLNLEWTAKNTENPSYQITKTFQSDTETISYGFLNILPNKSKPFQYSPSDNTGFVVLKGSVEAVIHKTAKNYERFDSFFVPYQTAYMIKNKSSVNALLSYCTSKDSFFSDNYK